MNSPGSTRVYWWPWPIIAAALKFVTSVAYEKIPPSSHSLVNWLIAPGFLGEFIVRGIHSGASSSTIEIAWSMANAAFWTAVLKSIFVRTGSSIAAQWRGNSQWQV